MLVSRFLLNLRGAHATEEVDDEISFGPMRIAKGNLGGDLNHHEDDDAYETTRQLPEARASDIELTQIATRGGA